MSTSTSTSSSTTLNEENNSNKPNVASVCPPLKWEYETCFQKW
jgi:hypothetical protein